MERTTTATSIGGSCCGDLFYLAGSCPVYLAHTLIPRTKIPSILGPSPRNLSLFLSLSPRLGAL